MVDRLDYLFQEWYRLGGAVLLAEIDPDVTPRAPEDVIAESSAYCRQSGRLTWVVLDWLIQHISEIDERYWLFRRLVRWRQSTTAGSEIRVVDGYLPTPR